MIVGQRRCDTRRLLHWDVIITRLLYLLQRCTSIMTTHMRSWNRRTRARFLSKCRHTVALAAEVIGVTISTWSPRRIVINTPLSTRRFLHCLVSVNRARIVTFFAWLFLRWTCAAEANYAKTFLHGLVFGYLHGGITRIAHLEITRTVMKMILSLLVGLASLPRLLLLTCLCWCRAPVKAVQYIYLFCYDHSFCKRGVETRHKCPRWHSSFCDNPLILDHLAIPFLLFIPRYPHEYRQIFLYISSSHF